MALLEINRDPTPRQVRQFAMLLLPGFCALLAGLALYRFDTWPVAIALAAGGAASLTLGLLRPRWMRLVFLGWMWAAFPIGWAVSHALMAVMYFGVITPIGLAMRLAGRDPLARSFDRKAETYWTARTQAGDTSRYFRQF
jgi:hypothetical protein